MSSSSQGNAVLEGIAIIGMSGRFPGAKNTEEFWRNLVNGVESISRFREDELEFSVATDEAKAQGQKFVGARAILQDVEQFDASFFGIYPREAEVLDPQHRLFLECAWESIEMAGYDSEKYPGLIGVYGGVSLNTYLLYNVGVGRELAGNYQVGLYQAMLGNDKDFLPTRVSYKLNLRGPSMTIQCACSTSLVAVAQACSSLLSYQCDMALAGGSSISFPQKRDYLYTDEGMVSGDGTLRAFDAEARGTVFGHGTAVVLLKRLADAVADGDHVLAVIKGSAVNNDGSEKIGYAAPSIKAQAEVIALAQAVAGVEPDSISYVEAHGTGTPLGDPIEVAALTQAFRAGGATGNGYCALGTGKTHISHLDVAAGATGLIKTVMQLQHEQIPALLHFKSPNPKIDFANSPFYPVSRLTEWKRGSKPRRAGVSAFGVGGTNAHVVVEEAPLPEPRVTKQKRHLIVLSAKTPTALDSMTRNLADWLEQRSALPPLRAGEGTPPTQASRPDPVNRDQETQGLGPDRDFSPAFNPCPSPIPGLRFTERAGVGCPDSNTDLFPPLSNALLADVAFTLQRGRKAFTHRRAVVLSGPEDAVKALRSLDAKTSATGQAPTSEPEVVFLFPGQGAQYVDMGREVYAKEPVFRDEIDRCANILQTHLGTDIRTILHPTPEGRAEAEKRIHETAMTQPAIFVIEYALAKLWQSWGIQPSVLIGHSIGEYVCAVLAETFTLEDALALLAVRARLMQALPPGSMLAVRLPGAEVEPLLPKGASIAAYNSAKLCTVSGPTEVLKQFQQDLEGRKVAAKLLPTSHAFHSGMMDPMLPEFTAAVSRTRRATPKVRWISTCTGTWMTPEDLADPGYWSRQLRQAVRFADALALVAGDRRHLLLEVGPGQALTQLARQHPGKPADLAVVSSFGPGSEATEEVSALYAALGRLWVAGAAPNWEALHAGERRQRVPLPTYPFERKRFWVEPAQPGANPSQTAGLAVSPGPISSFTPSASIQFPMSDSSSTSAAASATPARRPRLAAEIRKNIENLSGLQLASDTASFLELGFDSLFLTQASQALQKQFGIKITFRQLINDLNTVDALAAHLDATLPPDRTPVLSPSSVASPAPVLVPGAALNLTAGSNALQQLFAQQTAMLQQQLALLQALGVSAGQGTGTMDALSASAPAASSGAIAASVVPAEATVARAFIPAKDLGHSGDVTLTDRQRQYVNALIERYTRRTAGSKAQTQQYRQWYADPRTASGFNRLWKEMVYQIVVTKSSGSKLWDVDGNEYIDLLNGFGPGFLGHSPEFITRALKDQLDKGIEVGPQSPLAGEAAKLFCELTGNERASFVCTGSEAVYAAMRLARTVTGRDKIVVFTRDYHGNFDEVLVRAVGAPPQIRSMPIAPGIPFRAVEDMWVLDYGTEAALEFIKAHATEIAAVLVEPVQSRRPEWRPKQFIQDLRRVTSEHGALLIFDEVVTGLRTGPGGAQAYYGVKADLATYGKVIGGGMPVGIVAGKAEFMDTFDGGFWQYGDDSFPSRGVTFFAGTFVRHPLAIAAVHAMLKFLHAQGPEFWDAINRRAARLATTLDRFFVERAIPIRVPHFKSFMFVRMGEDQKHGNLLFYRLREKGVFLLEHFPSYLTAAHSEADIDKVIAAFQESALELVEAGLLAGALRPGDPVNREAASDASRNAPDHGVVVPQLAQPVSRFEESRGLAAGTGNRFPLTTGQQEMWLAAQMSPEMSGTHNATNIVTLRGALHVEMLRRAIRQTIERHDALRATFCPDGTEVLVANRIDFEFPVTDLAGFPPEEKQRRVEAIHDEEGRRLFDLVKGPLFSFQLVRLAETEHQLLFSVQMIACDGWSYNLVLEDVAAIYSALVQGNEPVLSPAVSMQEYVRWQRQPERVGETAACGAFWLAKFSKLPAPLDLPLTRTRPPQRTSAGDRQSLRLGPDLFQSLKQAAREMKATPFSVLLTAYYVWLYRLGGQSDLVVGVPFAGQGGAGLEKLVGQCVHTLPLRLGVDARTSFTTMLRQVREVFLDAQEQWNYGFGQLVQKLDLPRDPSRIPLVSVIFNLDVPMDRIRFHGCTQEIVAGPRHYFQYDLGFNLVDEGSTLLVECDYNRNLFDAATIRAWLGHFQTLLRGVVAQHDQPVGLLPLHEATQRTPWRRENWRPHNAGSVGLHDLVSQQAARTPARIAVQCGVESLAYSELETRSNQLAWLLRSVGVDVGSAVAVCVRRNLDMVVAVLGVLKAGAAYVPIDPDLPEVRMAGMIEDSGAKVILTHGTLIQQIPARQLRVICIDEDRDAIAREDVASPGVKVTPDQLAYIIFTSGSTGRPKGVEVSHEAAVNFLRSMQREPGLSQEDVVLALTTLSFDISVLEIFLPLIVGARTVVVPREILIDPHELEAVIERQGVTMMQATPATWRMLFNAGWKGGRKLRALCGGEAMLPDLAARMLAACGEVWNMYGPTETTVWSMVARVRSGEPVVLGGPIDNTWVGVVDEHLQPVATGVAGELLIGGAGVARGYRHRPELTDERFIDDPFAPAEGSRWHRCYRTGDLVRFRADGTIEFIGRRDHQVKMRGHRVELGEVETVLVEHAGVCDAAVVLREDAQGHPCLAAYLVPTTPQTGEKVARFRSELRQWLLGRLPDYMVPAAFVCLQQIPRTPEGKKDRAGLPGPDMEAFDASEEFIAPRSAVEKTLAGLWSEILKIESVGIRQSFFELGGQSLMAVALFARMEKEFGRRLPLATLLRAPTIEQLSMELDGRPTVESAGWKSLVPIQTKGSRPPLFLVHGAGGNVLLYRALAERLAPEQPIYGLQSRGLDGASTPLQTIEEMAAEYLREIRSVQPVGPYHLGGYCLGGTVAYEMAQLLKQAGESVELVALLDTYNFSRALKVSFAGFLREKLKFHLGNFLRLRPQDMVRYLGEKIRIARDGELANLLTSRPGSAPGAGGGAGVARAESGIEASVQAINDAAAEHYLPKPYAGRIALFKPQVNYKFYPDPQMGWGDLVAGGLDIVELPVNPHAMLVEPYVEMLAEQLRKRVQPGGAALNGTNAGGAAPSRTAPLIHRAL